jgi:Transposase DDE domain
VANQTVAPRSTAFELAGVLDSPEIAAFISELQETRWTGRPGYPIRAMVGMALAKSIYSIPTWTRTVALVREHDALREAIAGTGEVPSVYACYRFAAKLRAYSDLLDACIARVLVALKHRNPGMGADVAIDGSDLPAYANGQRYLSKNGPERERYSDPDASWGHRSAVSTRKGGGFYGYKVHAAVCAATDLPLAWTVETASAAEANFALPLIDAVKDRGFALRTAIMDKGYDTGPIHDGCMDGDVCPVTALVKSERVKRGEHKPPTCEHGTWTFAGADYKRRATKWRCRLASASPRQRGSRLIGCTRSSRAPRNAHASSTAAAPLSSASSVGSRTSGRYCRSAFAALSASGYTQT